MAVSTGEAARDVVEEGEDEMFDVMQQHEDMMEQARNVFVALTVIYAGIVILPLLAKSLQGMKFAFPANLVFLAALMGANLFMASGAHLGGRLVHQYGVKSALAPEGGEPAAASEAEKETPDAEKEATAAEGEKEAPAQSEKGRRRKQPAPDAEGKIPAPDAEKESPVEAPKTEAPATEPKTEAPAPEPAKDGAAKEATEP